MTFNARSFATLGMRRKLTWGASPRARSARPTTPSPFFRPMSTVPTSATSTATQPPIRRAA